MTAELAPSADERWRALALVAAHLRPLLGGAGPDTAPDERLIAPASHHLVSPALGWCAAARFADDPVAGYFGAALELNRSRNESILSGLDLALDRLAAAGIVPVLLKGVAMLAGGVYPDAGVRVIGDLDLLVPESDLARADTLLRRAGFRPLADAAVSEDHHHLPMLVLEEVGAGVELHRWPLPRRWSHLLPADDVIGDAEDVSYRGRACRVPSPTAMVAHLVAHSQLVDHGHERKTMPLRGLLDLACIAHRRADRVDWERLSQAFRRARRPEVLAMACAASDHLFGPATPFAARSEAAAAWLEAGLCRSPLTRKLIHARRRLGEDLHGNPAHLRVAFNPFAWRALFRQNWSLWQVVDPTDQQMLGVRRSRCCPMKKREGCAMADQDRDDQDVASAKRREALKTLAKYGAYTAPVMLGLLTASKAVAQSGGGGACCWVGSYLARGQRVGDTSAGAPLRMMTPDGVGTSDGVVERVRLPAPQPCRTFATVSGITLTLTDSTPVPVRRRGLLEYLRAVDVVEGDVVPVEDAGGFRWEPLADIDPREPLRVGYISAGDGVYAAGDQPDRMIYTHNVSTF